MEIEDQVPPHPRQFVILKHVMPALAARPTHWDLMIESGEQLLTFELQQLPEAQTRTLMITRLADHRRAYLNFTGPLPPDVTGTDRGSVERIAAGWARCRHDPATGLIHCQLTADELKAEFEYSPCDIGQTTGLAIYCWQLSPSAPRHGSPKR